MSTGAPTPRARTGPWLLVGLVLAALAVAGYFVLAPRSSPPAPSAVATPSPAASGAPRPLSDEQLERMVAEASEQVARTPDDAHAWAMLAHTYDMLGKFAESSKAYASLVRLRPGDAQALVDYADALAIAHGRTLAGKPTALVERALKIDPSNPKALALAGTAAFERKDYDAAISFWEQARDRLTDASLRSQVESSIADARAATRGEPAATAPTKAAALPAGAASAVSGRVSLADDLVATTKPDATVFIFARPARGSRMPVALLRKRVSDLPVDFTLDDTMAMVPGATLSKAGTVVIGARVSSRGDVMPQPGDVQGWSAPVEVGTRNIRLEISEVLQ